MGLEYSLYFEVYTWCRPCFDTPPNGEHCAAGSVFYLNDVAVWVLVPYASLMLLPERWALIVHAVGHTVKDTICAGRCNVFIWTVI